MKTNTLITRPLATALLLTLLASQSSCDSAEPVKPKRVIIQPLPDIAFDTLTVHPYEPRPVSVEPATTVQPQEVLPE